MQVIANSQWVPSNKKIVVLLYKVASLFVSAQELAALVVNVVNGRPVYLQDVATVSDGAATPQDYTFYYPGGTSNGQQYPAVFLAVAKQKGANAVSVAEAVLAELETLEAEWVA